MVDVFNKSCLTHTYGNDLLKVGVSYLQRSYPPPNMRHGNGEILPVFRVFVLNQFYELYELLYLMLGMFDADLWAKAALVLS